MLKIGDLVEAVDDDIKGTIISFKENVVQIETSEGFQMSFEARQLIVSNNQFELMQKTQSTYKPKSSDINTSKKANKPIKTKKNEFVFEVDLHIEKLIPKFNHLSNYDILNIQMDTAKGQLEFAIQKKFPKIVFIHGLGEGVLKSELHFMLGRYTSIQFQDANYNTYGMGATEVIIFQK